MAKTYDAYIANTLYELVFRNGTDGRTCMRMSDISEKSLNCLKSLADNGVIALAYEANEEDQESEDA